MKKLDLYIIKKFLGTFFFIIGIFILITIVFDVSEKIDDFLDREAPLEAIVFDYYCTFIPWLYSTLNALIVFLAVIFFTSKLAGNNEIMAILSAGISFNRMLKPYMLTATLLFALSLFINHFVIPITNKRKLDFENRYYHDSNHIDLGNNIHRKLQPDVFMYVSTYGSYSKTAYNFSLDQMKDGKLFKQFKADRIIWDSASTMWVAKSWRERTIDGMRESFRSGDSKDTTWGFRPEDFSDKPNQISTMNYFEITDFIEEEEQKGSAFVKRYQLELHKRTAIPFSIIILTVIGVSISSRKIKGGLGMHLVYGISLGLIYVFLSRVGEVFATNTNFSPAFAVWIPNIFFTAVAWFIYKLAPK
ncbi:MAG: LptF/LptG family permease [Flavobacteriales bacterium]